MLLKIALIYQDNSIFVCFKQAFHIYLQLKLLVKQLYAAQISIKITLTCVDHKGVQRGRGAQSLASLRTTCSAETSLSLIKINFPREDNTSSESLFSC